MKNTRSSISDPHFSIFNSFVFCNTDELAMASLAIVGTGKPRTRNRSDGTWHNHGIGICIPFPTWSNSHPNSILSWASSKTLFGVLFRVATLTPYTCSVVQSLIWMRALVDTCWDPNGCLSTCIGRPWVGCLCKLSFPNKYPRLHHILGAGDHSPPPETCFVTSEPS